jgi:hypothetical protein
VNSDSHRPIAIRTETGKLTKPAILRSLTQTSFTQRCYVQYRPT